MEQLRQLEQAQARWRSLGIHDYSFVYWVTCCWFRDHVRYVIQADTVASAVGLDSLSQLSPPQPITIDSLFSQAREILAADGWYSLRIAYDTGRSYPTVIAADTRVPDASWADSVSDFVPLR
jgi:hypothetical protein